jgi:Xaa-Pro dipeptidase
MAIHFRSEEFEQRVQKLCVSLHAQDLDGLLIFKQESMYYLTGYDTFGFCFFQCLYFGADGRKVLMTRAPDLRQAQHTSTLDDIRVWTDEADASPAVFLRNMLEELGCRDQCLGIELDSYGLTGRNWGAVQSALESFCTLTDASEIVTRLRMIKSQSELLFVEQAAELADDALDEAVSLARSGESEGRILAGMHSVIFSAGGDYPGNEFVIGSGRDALLCRYHSGRRVLDDKDQLTLEFAGVYRHYHACLMRTLIIGSSCRQQIMMHSVCREALAACLENVRPGNSMGTVFDAHTEVMDKAGFQAHRLNACGYSLGATFTPTWMDYPMFFHGNAEPIAAGMVLFLHMILMNSEEGYAMTLGETVKVTEAGAVRLSRHGTDLIVRD